MRPHNGLCMQFFVGKGYSEEFVENMANIKQAVENSPQTEIVLVEKDDAICSECPNKDKCAADGKAARYDRECLETLKLAFGTKLTWKVFNALICSKIVADPCLREKICGDCQWNCICQQANVEKLSKVLKTI